jgi:hypothetical protein
MLFYEANAEFSLLVTQELLELGILITIVGMVVNSCYNLFMYIKSSVINLLHCEQVVFGNICHSTHCRHAECRGAGLMAFKWSLLHGRIQKTFYELLMTTLSVGVHYHKCSEHFLAAFLLFKAPWT